MDKRWSEKLTGMNISIIELLKKIQGWYLPWNANGVSSCKDDYYQNKNVNEKFRGILWSRFAQETTHLTHKLQ